MSDFISQEGFDKLMEEWKRLKFVERPEMQRQVGAAAAEGDRSENAAYTYGKMRLRDIDRRLRELDKIIDHAKVVSTNAPADGSIRFGATVTLQDKKTNRQRIYTLVGVQEIDPIAGRISVNSPVGMALIGKKQGDSVTIEIPRGKVEYAIIGITYK
ncbi:MAG: transcription elongation factor GreA [Fibrobacter intestinalis]|uniref:Transcription elongation factor GreA n=1 Tax=Fibrobacter intestinalis TaxID=28122 RepID=A0A1T4MN29_9BACT|nr:MULTISPECIES: transcription elongation factor GreA [Fibrobacter]MDD7297804.1 transcription elongation factor GreA [Fibrobacter intestinalis]PBC73436.1 transcription elongation factor GreB [Fibrobacter sp. NR9]SJZ68226.1 transcription elongation factor GreB [Fibrobacter intestinalis]